MTALLAFSCLALGALLGWAAPLSPALSFFEHGEGVFLSAMMLFSGILLGSQQDARGLLRGLRPDILLLPAATVLGSLAGGLVSGALLGIPAGAALAVSGGMCWYSLSGALVGEALGASFGAAAFFSGLFREMAALALIPLLGKKLGIWEAAGAAAAVSGDVCLPAIMRCGGGSASAAVINGLCCTALVPVLVPLFLSI